jgi:hypothetical protein
LADWLAATIAALRIQLQAAGVSTLPVLTEAEQEAALAWGDMFEAAAMRRDVVP